MGEDKDIGQSIAIRACYVDEFLSELFPQDLVTHILIPFLFVWCDNVSKCGRCLDLVSIRRWEQAQVSFRLCGYCTVSCMITNCYWKGPESDFFDGMCPNHIMKEQFIHEENKRLGWSVFGDQHTAECEACRQINRPCVCLWTLIRHMQFTCCNCRKNSSYSPYQDPTLLIDLCMECHLLETRKLEFACTICDILVVPQLGLTPNDAERARLCQKCHARKQILFCTSYTRRKRKLK